MFLVYIVKAVVSIHNIPERVMFKVFISPFVLIVRPEDAERGLQACRGKMFLGAEMDLQYWQG